MKTIRKSIEKFCYRHPNFGVQRLMLYIIIASAAVFILYSMDTTRTLFSLLDFNPYYIIRGQIWRIVTWIFLPISGSLFGTAVSLYFYYFIGSTLEAQWGTARFTIYYFIGVILNIVYGFAVWIITGHTVSLTPTYLNLSMFFAFATLFPDQRVLLFFIIPIKIKWLAFVDAAFFIYYIILYSVSGAFAYALLPIVAIANFIIFCGKDLFRFIRYMGIHRHPNIINFSEASTHMVRNNQQENKNYTHKCAVCGRTDTEFPELEFRYCSRCTGYHCFCIEHINNHIHFTD